jgi:hypothetical protein
MTSNWYTHAHRDYWLSLYKEAERSLNPESRNWAKPTYDKFVKPNIGELAEKFPRKIRMLWENGSNFARALLPFRNKFLQSLQMAFKAAVGLIKGNPKAFGFQAAQTVKGFLAATANAFGGNEQHGRKGVMNSQQGFDTYIKPLLTQPIDFTTWWKKTTSAGAAGNGAIKNPMNSMGYAGRAPVGADDFKNNMEYRGVAKNWNEFAKMLRSDQSNVQGLKDLARRVADASDRLFSSTLMEQTQTKKRVDMFSQFISPAMPDQFPNNMQGRERFNNCLRPFQNERPDIIQWKKEIKFLLHEAWSHPPYRRPDGQPSGFIQKLLSQIKARPAAFKPLQSRMPRTNPAAAPTLPQPADQPQNGSMAAAPALL